MMAHQIHVLDRDDANTFRVNVSACKPYGADFDGDEMNIHLAQSIQARNELKRIANVKFQIIGVKDSNPIIGCQQDALSGAFVMTQKEARIKGSDAANILCNTSSKTKYEIDMNKEYTGIEIFTKIIPKGINHTKKNDKGDITFQIKNGELLAGLLDKSSLSVSKNSIIHFIWDKYGPNKTREFIDDAQKLILNYLLVRGLTISFKDSFLEAKFEEQIKKLLDNTVLENKYNLTQYENEVDQISPQIIEASLYSQMNAIGSDVGATIKKNLNASNFFWALVTSGAKGSETNLQQMMACIGQQALEGRRIAKKVEGRSLIYFHKDDDTPEARGFTRSSLLDGLKGYEAFIFTAAGREGLIDTAIKSVTWETPIVIIENNQPKYTEIGKWIDYLLETNSRKVKHYTDRQMELLDTEGIFIPTTDENGTVTWGNVSAITRHDPGTQLYEIKTNGGRKVTVTESKSLLIWDKTTKKLKEMLTPDIKVGDCVPVTETLCEPPIIMEYIELSNYLPKKEYIYGTDFHKAIELMNTAMEDRFAVPTGWWERNNGTNFTLPYTKKASLQRCSVRSKEIKDGFVFPYGGNRNATLIADKFPLNKDNGIFIGLFLAEGNVSNSSVRITNTNENVKTFVRNWFDKHNIKWDEENRINKIGGETNSIRGFSTILADFLTKLVGHGAEHKFVPSEAFIASEEFIVGLLNGYFSGDGCITKNSIDASSASKRLIEGISMLCSRIGVFCKVYTTQLKSNNLNTENILPSHRIRISAQWAKVFSQKVTLLEENKDKKMKDKKWCKAHKNFDTLNNVVLDEITEINLIDVALHPKVYDLTIPSTLNFGLANGLQVRDTAQTGYLQRKLIKGLEDLSIKYDGTNRNSRGVVIQYVYGENGINQACQTEIKLNIMEMDNKKLEERFNFTDDQLKKIEKKHKITMKDLKAFNTKYLNKMKGYRDEMRTIQMKALLNFKTMEEKFMLPVNLFRLTQDYSSKTENLELKPQDIVDSIEDFLNLPETKLLPVATKGNDRLKQDDRSLKFILEVALYEYLSPNKCIFDYGLTKDKLKNIWDEIRNSFVKAIAEPGEMVGILAAQSIGEPTTQLNLNTKHFAGVSSKSGAVSGVPRILELLSFSKDIKTPQITVYFDNAIRSDRIAVNRIASYFKYLSIKQLIDTAEIYYNPVGTNIDKRITADNVSTPFFTNNQKAELSSLPFIFRLKMNIEKMLDKETTLLDIKTKFVSYWYKNFTNLKTMKRNEKDIFSKISRCAILSNSTADKEQIIHIRFSISTFNYQILVDFLNIVLNDIALKGIDGINDISMDEQRVIVNDVNTGANLVEKEYVVTTYGINLEKLKYMKGINNSRVLINDIFTIYKHYGIEATRNILMVEYMKVLGDKLNNTHLSLLVDMMTHNGDITSIDRHGLSKLDSDPCAKASFEQTMDHFINAAIFNEKDTMKSISSNIMLGKIIPGGTGSFDLILDTNKLENSEYTADETGGRITFTPLEEDSILKDIIKYGINQPTFFMPFV
jgi:DNA-directed RNA polymerase beta' subunit/intein/homing endonuclease